MDAASVGEWPWSPCTAPLDRRWRVEVDDRGVCRITRDRALVHVASSVGKAAEWLRGQGVDGLVRD